MNHNKPLKIKQKGLALPLVMCVVLILSILGVGLLTLGYQTRLRAIRTASEIFARSAADAGVTKALYDMNTKLQTKPWNDSTLPLASDVALPGCDAIYSYTITKSGSDYVVTSTGNYGQTQKQVTGTLSLKSPFDCPIFGDQSATLYNSSTVDQYNTDSSTPALWAGTNSISSKAFTLKNNAQMNGNVIVGVDGNPSAVIDNKGTISGTQYAMTELYKLLSISVPASLAALPSQGTLTGGTLNSSAKCNLINLGNSDTLTIDGQVSLYVIGNISLGNSAQIQVNPNASLIVYLGGNLSSNNGSGINNQTQTPKKMLIYGLDTCTSMNFKNNSAMYGAIYAPRAAVTYYNGVPLYGSIIAKSFETKNSAAIHYDASLRNANANDEAVTFKIKTWSDD